MYLPSDLTQKEMHRNYQETNNSSISYQFYGRVMKSMNIGMVKLGHEECESCIEAIQHQQLSKHTAEMAGIDSCSICEKYFEHLRLAKAARTEYREDGESIKPGHVVLAVDLQKVIQLPRMEGLKTIVFSQRLIAFNETFAPVGKYTRALPVVACVWNEAIRGRSSADLLGCFHRVVTKFSKVDKLVLWLDNCAAQNKNWNLFLHLIILLNSKNIQMKELVLKFFESGHTFMAADSFHAAVEGAMRRHPPITYSDFKAVVQGAKQKVEVMDMVPEHFFTAAFTVSQYVLNKLSPRPYIDNIRQVVIKKGSLEFYYSNSVNGDDLKSCKIFTTKQENIISSDDFDLEHLLKKQCKPRGIDEGRKSALLGTILPMIDEEKQQFWIDLPTIGD
ncbi:uncharacterized protein LOC134227031 [Armigeres subalbatus]|uniref:uncharacterized protein LOC134227031 n=1 Tax=Armigeres subalbatus TaxID=124917 RepID=UPI002ED529EF